MGTPEAESFERRREQALKDEDYELVSELFNQEDRYKKTQRGRFTEEVIARSGFDYLRSHKPFVPPQPHIDKQSPPS